MLISIIQAPVGGCQYHRQLSPNGLLNSKGIEVIQTTSLRIIEDWSKWKVCQFNNKDVYNHAPTTKLQGLKTWFDLDDTWRLETRHPFFKSWNRWKNWR